LHITTEEFDSIMKTNIYAPFFIIKEALLHLPPGSAIIGTTSEQAYNPDAWLYAYGQTKAATMNYVKSLAKQLGAKGYPREWCCTLAGMYGLTGKRRDDLR
jgi:NAD(P)-dependent dehydrogenase (short-subunit alcohol dehydrogenase family)